MSTLVALRMSAIRQLSGDGGNGGRRMKKLGRNESAKAEDGICSRVV